MIVSKRGCKYPLNGLQVRQRAVDSVLHGLGAGLPNRWAFALVDAWEEGVDVTALRREVSAIRSAVTATDDELREHAKRAAQLCSFGASAAMKSAALRTAHEVAMRHGVDVERLPYDEPLTYQRMMDSRWWLLQIRRAHALAMEGGAIKLGLVHRFTNGDAYASRETVARRRQQRKRNDSMLSGHDVVATDTGETISLAEVAAGSVSNKAVRRGELMVRLRGFEEIANELGHKPIFVTITCPSRFHKISGNEKSGAHWVNKNYAGQLPREAQDYLCRIWARIRAEAARAGVQMYGFRVAEPHHDGCPHWHVLLWVSNLGQRSAMRRIVADHALRDTPDEPGAKEHRVKFVHIKPWLGAVGYIAKYIAKSVDGVGVEFDLLGNPIMTTCAAVDAWASTWRIRQFQQIGGPPVGVWREVRRIEDTSNGLYTSQVIASAVDCVNKTEESRADFAGFVRVMGGPIATRREMRLKLLHRERYRPTRYGDRFVRSIAGVECQSTGQLVETRSRVWRIVRRSDADACVESARSLIEEGSLRRDLGLVSITVRNENEERGPYGSNECSGAVHGSGNRLAALHGAGKGSMHHSQRFRDDG